MSNLIDTTEMYLKTIYELDEDGVAPLRARIVERLGHSGPTVSQTVARIERDGYLRVGRDRRIRLTDLGKQTACQVIRKHRLSECLLLNVLQLPLSHVNAEACRWEHVMSDEVAHKVDAYLQHPQYDPFGNPIPGNGANKRENEVSAADAVDMYGKVHLAHVTRIGEPLQASVELVSALIDMEVLNGQTVTLIPSGRDVVVAARGKTLLLPGDLARHLFVQVEEERA